MPTVSAGPSSVHGQALWAPDGGRQDEPSSAADPNPTKQILGSARGFPLVHNGRPFGRSPDPHPRTKPSTHFAVRIFLLFLVSFLFLTSSASQAQDQLVKQALTRIEKYEKLEPSLKEGDVETANRYINDLNYAAKRLKAAYDKTTTHYKDAVQRYGAIVEKIQTKARAGTPPPKPAQGYDLEKLRQLNKEINAAYENLQMLSVAHMKDDFRRKSVAKEIEGFTERLAAFPTGDENVTIVTGNLANFRNLYEGALAKLAQDEAGLPEVLAKLEVMRAKYDRKKLPVQPELPLTEDEVTLWVNQIANWRNNELPADLAFVQGLQGNSAANQQTVSSILNMVAHTWPRYLNEMESGMRDKCYSDAFRVDEYCDGILEIDPADRDQVQNRILGQGNFDGNLNRLRKYQNGVKIAALWDNLMQVEDHPDRVAQAAKVEKAIGYLQKLAVDCLDQVRMPQAASTDEGLLKIAGDTLKASDYKVAGWESMVINVDKARREKREAYIRGESANSASVEYYHYVWDQFQVTTAEREGDKVWLYATTFCNYSSGGSTTPLNRWFVSGRIQLTPILPENIGK